MDSEGCSNTDLSDALSSLVIGDDDVRNNMATCANCGKEGDGDSMNSCNKCDLVVYCNAACKKKHKSKHKKKCERRVAELYDKKLFKEHQTRKDCPICFLPLPYGAVVFKSCCGKDIGSGCIVAMVLREGVHGLCPFCRTPDAKTFKEEVARATKLMEKGNADAYYLLAGYYFEGCYGLPRDRAKANELWLKAGELGRAGAYYNLGNASRLGQGMEIDMKKANSYFELAAMGGCVHARHNLGCAEDEAGNQQRAYKHLLLAARAGHKRSLDAVTKGYTLGIVTKDEYEGALRAHYNHQLKTKSEMRDMHMTLERAQTLKENR